MNKEEALQQNEELKKYIENYDKPKPLKRWRAKHGERYYYIDNHGDVCFYYDDRDETDDYYYISGNYYQIEDQAAHAQKVQLATQQLKDLALELDNGVELNFKNKEQKKYYIYLYINSLNIDYDGNTKNQGTIYCLDKNFLKIAIERLGEDTVKLAVEG